MKPNDDPFVPLVQENLSLPEPEVGTLSGHWVGRLQGFDLLEQPLVGALAACPGRVLACRSTVPLRSAHRGREVLVIFEQGDRERPIIVGVVEPHPLQDAPAMASAPQQGVRVEVDGERQLIQAEREIVLRCGEASITLTRAGKVIIRGNYILSRSSGYNKIKGAAIDIN
ncbi:MAG: hypothetical protein KGL18_07490 [Burkholderiales bacterium]|nr:hypothetical protein [Burkholderiales bacterium]MDE1926071.1 hypothetical protein [Burkholderiales bacterium]MDE2502802.1 hypothetical protein [Burkholderiales bacterium]